MQHDRVTWSVCGTLLVWVAGLLFTGVPATAEEQQVSGNFFEPLEVPLVTLDVFVSDSEDRPVPGMTIGDFQVLDDGEPVEITNFSASPAVAEDGEQRETGSGDAEEKPSVTPSQDLYLAVYVDETNFNFSQRRVVLDNLRTFFTQELPKHLQVMLVSYGNTLQVRQALTDDPELLLSALESCLDQTETDREIKRHANPNLDPRSVNSTAEPHLWNPVISSDQVSIAESLLLDIESYAKQRHQSNKRNIASLQSFVRSLSGLPGRKAVLYLSNGMEIRAGEDLFTFWERSFERLAQYDGIHAKTRANQYNVQRDLSLMVEYANTYRVCFYALRPPGRGQLSRLSAASHGVQGSPKIGIIAEEAGEDGLVLMTSGTGGRILSNTRGLGEQLSEVAEELGSHYSLSFQPTGTDTDRYHTVKVTVTQPVRIRHRKGYRIPSVASHLEDQTLTAALFGISKNPLGITAAAAQHLLRDDGSYTVPLLIKVPLDLIVLAPQATTHEGRISIFVVVRDENGRLSDGLRREYPLQIKNRELLQVITQQAGYTIGLQMHQGPHVVAVGVRDELGGLASIISLDITVGEGARVSRQTG